jgi:hypothetical protein
MFLQLQHAVYYEISQNALKAIKHECGSEFDALWAEAVGQPQPAWLAAAAGAQLALEQLARLPQLANMLIAWVQTPDWDASRAYLEQHQSELLTDEAEIALQGIIQVNDNHPELVRHLELLRKARREGIAAAYAQFGIGDASGAP